MFIHFSRNFKHAYLYLICMRGQNGGPVHNVKHSQNTMAMNYQVLSHVQSCFDYVSRYDPVLQNCKSDLNEILSTYAD